jgi:hypothetical protein
LRRAAAAGGQGQGQQRWRKNDDFSVGHDGILARVLCVSSHTATTGSVMLLSPLRRLCYGAAA